MLIIKHQSPLLGTALELAENMATGQRAEFITPEHLLLAICDQGPFGEAVEQTDDVAGVLVDHLNSHTELVPETLDYDGADPSVQLGEAIGRAYEQFVSSSAVTVNVPQVIAGMLSLSHSFAADLLQQLVEATGGELLSMLIDAYAADSATDGDAAAPEAATAEKPKEWLQYVSCINDSVDLAHTIIGREAELRRTIEVLCRRDKNNPLHVGEPGVGKTALARGVAELIERGDVPVRLRHSRIYSLDLGALMAGTQYRGEMEKRLKAILNGCEEEQGAILYIDEIHQLIGAGRVDGGGMDAAGLLKPYLERGSLRFMGATTYDEYNRHIVRHKGFARRFDKIDVLEPTVDECLEIVHGVSSLYAEFHHVTFTDEALRYAVEASAKYISDRRLPDKAIDLIDEAGASHEAALTGSTDEAEPHAIDRPEVAQVLARVCHVDTLAEDRSDADALLHLADRMRQRVFGQDEAVDEVAEAVLMGSAGLLAEGKPMASLLFVGPTGVGKTEVARVLADELRLPLVRFDMSEYAEKHTVAKLIGAPAGYVGYDDGGLLTDAIRKQPHCVLLLDEIEKAHSDIYNILLQVMDYAVLTDNRGQKADFRHVVLIMTTNAGAQYARQAAPGFVRSVSAGQAMMKSVKQTFKPEFLNRLTAVTVFHDMNEDMAARVLQKKVGELEALLKHKNVTLTLTPAARKALLSEGFSPEYGGREMERVINARLKPLLTRAILFGKLKQGGEARVDYTDKQYTL